MARHLLAGLLAALGLQTAQADDLKPGDPAPDFALVDQTGRTRALSDFRGRWLVLYFYPKDDTPGCTTEACSFRDDISALAALGAQVLGVSTDDAASHTRFAEKFHLPFPLLADTDGRTARAYGALLGFGPLKFARRHSFIIAPGGRIAKIYREVRPATHSREIRADLEALQKAR